MNLDKLTHAPTTPPDTRNYASKAASIRTLLSSPNHSETEHQLRKKADNGSKKNEPVVRTF